jgi:SAM-dependent methyltransferase
MSRIAKYSIDARRGRRLARRTPAQFQAADSELTTTLGTLDSATNYTNWVISLARPWIGGRILEVGAGHGTFSERLARLGDLVVSEPSPRALAVLTDRLRARSDLQILHGDLASAAELGPYESVVLFNVLEHIEDDGDALQSVASALEPGGRVVILAPAFDCLYSRFDASVGHYRRYRIGGLSAKVEEAGMQVVHSCYVNSIGFVAWLLTAKVLGANPTRRHLAATYDQAVVPVLRAVERRVAPPFGQSVFLVGER